MEALGERYRETIAEIGFKMIDEWSETHHLHDYRTTVWDCLIGKIVIRLYVMFQSGGTDESRVSTSAQYQHDGRWYKCWGVCFAGDRAEDPIETIGIYLAYLEVQALYRKVSDATRILRERLIMRKQTEDK